MSESGKYIVTCNGVKLTDADHIKLEYHEGRDKNVNIDIKDFGTSVYKLSTRVKDLLEIAGYIFAADRESARGKANYVEYHGWSRSFHLHIKVRDYKFWKKPEVQVLLNDILCFITGDKEYKFTFYKGQPDFPTNLFDTEKFVLDTTKKLSIALFSGGLDSLAGIIERLETTNDEICLVSHQSGQPSVKQTQNDLYKALSTIYPNRCKHYKFHCGLSHLKSVDETQRTRSLLFTAMSFAIAHTYKQNEIYVYENGVTSLNFAKTQDMMNGRASRTTHPKTIALMEKFFTLVGDREFKIKHPYLFKTKTDVIKTIKKYKRLKLLDSAVSCSSTRNKPANHTHCGICSQCIDRRFAVYSAEVEKFDENGIYDFNFLKDTLEEPILIKSLTDYIRLAQSFADENEDSFYMNRADQIVEAEEFIEGKTETERLDKLFTLCKNHSKDIEYSLQRMEMKYFRPFSKIKPDSFYDLILKPRAYQVNDSDGNKAKQRMLLKKFIDDNYPTFISNPIDNVTKVAREYLKKYHPELINEARKKKQEAIRTELTNIRNGKIQLELNDQ